jgi:hypothetical protein
MLQTSKRWELFSDRERQEKFNKLMVIPSLPSAVLNILVLANLFISHFSKDIYLVAKQCTNTVLESEDALVAMVCRRV